MKPILLAAAAFVVVAAAPVPDPAALKTTITALVGFGTRHTLSTTTDPARGIGAARAWTSGQLAAIGAACGGCLAVETIGDRFTGPRAPAGVRVDDVLAVQRGTDPTRVVIVQGHIDSRVSDSADATSDAPGANDDASGVAVVLEAARQLSREKFAATIVYAVLSGEEQGLWGGQLLARTAKERGWQVAAVLNDDIVGNTHGIGGEHLDATVRVFSEGVRAAADTDHNKTTRSTGSEDDSPSRALAKAVARVADRIHGLKVFAVRRPDRFQRGGDHLPFLDAGFPAVRFTEAAENYDRQHQDVRTENGRHYGDTIDGVDFPYLARVAALNIAVLRELATAPPAPTGVTIAGAVSDDTTVAWAAVPGATGYRVRWRRADGTAAWTDARDVAAPATSLVLSHVNIDDHFFGVAALGGGAESIATFAGVVPRPAPGAGAVGAGSVHAPHHPVIPARSGAHELERWRSWMPACAGMTLMVMAVLPTNAHAATAEYATAAALRRVAALDPAIHAVIALDPTAIAQARVLDRATTSHGPLFGVPILIKDNIETAGPLPTTAGSLALAANVAGRDAPLVARLRAAGAVILGKTNLSEWANIRASASISGWSAVGGQTRNPHALDRSPCGSSSGSAAAVAAGMVMAAIGTETDGSITCPAAMTGVVGLKPTVGLVSRSRVVPISHSQDTPGPITADVTTAAQVLTAIAGSDPADPATADADMHRTDYAASLRPAALRGARIGVVRWIKGWSPAVTARFDAALAVLRSQGATLVDVDAFDREGLGAVEHVVLLTEFKVGLNAYLATTPPTVTTRTLADVIAFDAAQPRELALFGQDTFVAAEATGDDPGYRLARATSFRIARGGLDALFAHFDALVSPTESPAPPIGDHGAAASGPGSLAAVAGTPHLTVPMGTVAGLPVGLSFLGPAWSEARLLGYAYAYEHAAGGRVMPTFAASIETSAAIAPPMRPEKP